MIDVCITGSEFFQFDTAAAGPGFFHEIFRANLIENGE